MFNNLYKFTLLLLLGSIFAVSALNSATPTLKLPQNNESCVSKDATFEWSHVSGSSYYRLQIATDINFDEEDMIVDTSGITPGDTIISKKLPTYGTQYYWRVLAHIIGQTDEWADPFTFYTKNSPPELVAPEDGLVCQDLEQTFEWNSIPSGIDYKLQISNSPFFANIVHDTVLSETSVVFELPEYYTDYYWRVRGRYPGCTTDYSEVRTIQTLVGPPSADSDELFPNEEVGIELDIQLEWPEIDGAESYSLQVATDAGFTNLLVDETNIPAEPSTMRYDFQATDLNTMYYWRIKSFGNNCESAWSETFSYLTRYDQVQAISPGDSEECVNIAPEFLWTKSEFSDGYLIEIYNDENLSNLLFEFEINSGEDTSGVFNTNKENSNIYWRVKAKDDTNEGSWSESQLFKTTLASPILEDPHNDTTNLDLEIYFEWNKTTQGPVEYNQFQVSTSPDFDSNSIEVYIDSIVGIDTTLILSQYDTQYYWRLRTYAGGCFSAWSQPFTFTTIKGYPDLIDPANGQENVQTSYNFIWTKVPTANSYDIRLATNPNFENEFGFNGLETNNRLISGLQVNTTYYWKVRSNDKWGTSPWSTVFEFTTGKAGANTPILHLPHNQSVKIPIDETLRWYKSENADAYHLQIFSDRHLTNMVREFDNIPDTLYKLEQSLDNYTEYWWRVAAYNETVKTEFSNPFKFRTIAIPPFEKPLAIKPPDGAEDVSLDPTEFEWTKIQYTDIGGASDAGYYFEISDDQSFDDGNSNLQETFTVYSEFATLRILEPNTTYFWRVRGWNEAGVGPWSDTFSFETDDAVFSVPEGNYKDFGAKIVPNPVDNAAELRFNLDAPGYVNISIIDQLGNVVFEKMNYNAVSGTNNVELEIENLPSGVYLFNIQAGDEHQTGNILIAK